MKNKNVALVTGGASGICLEVALRLADRGMQVVVADNDAQGLAKVQSMGITTITTVQCDVENSQQVSQLFADLKKKHMLPTVLVNGVGGDARKIPFASLDNVALQTSLQQNLFTAFTMCQHALPHMVDVGYGRIVNFASVAGRTYTLFSNTAYVCAKSAVMGLTKQLAYEYAATGITVNAVAHGPIATLRIQQAWEQKTTEEQANILERIPMGRLGSVEEAASVVVHLCTPESGYSTGSILDINGGMYI